MPSRKTKAPATETRSAHDPRVAALLKALRTNRELGAIVEAFEGAARQGGRKFGSNGLKVGGKLFALFTQGTLVVKLPGERVTALVGQRVGKPFDPGHGRLMKGWLAVTSATASWPDLVKEAHAYVRETSR
jgi:hypothetical protein